MANTSDYVFFNGQIPFTFIGHFTSKIEFNIFINMSKSKKSRHLANRRHYQKNREKILQKRRASRFELQARLEYFESALFQRRLPPISELWKPNLPPVSNLLKPELPSVNDLFNLNPLNTNENTSASRP
ncbi:17088_t:CDS:2 [Gigaspora margarita]|uniref:17088_t:CDS:1 n=1 Tax=Gigaspora margarita TaxID=4874 RepID=A0ABM8VZP8_GIGMA|nr:17088_t:CDS:2 [Gigaspora margarita]